MPAGGAPTTGRPAPRAPGAERRGEAPPRHSPRAGPRAAHARGVFQARGEHLGARRRLGDDRRVGDPAGHGRDPGQPRPAPRRRRRAGGQPPLGARVRARRSGPAGRDPRGRPCARGRHRHPCRGAHGGGRRRARRGGDRTRRDQGQGNRPGGQPRFEHRDPGRPRFVASRAPGGGGQPAGGHRGLRGDHRGGDGVRGRLREQCGHTHRRRDHAAGRRHPRRSGPAGDRRGGRRGARRQLLQPLAHCDQPGDAARRRFHRASARPDRDRGGAVGQHRLCVRRAGGRRGHDPRARPRCTDRPTRRGAGDCAHRRRRRRRGSRSSRDRWSRSRWRRARWARRSISAATRPPSSSELAEPVSRTVAAA